MRKKGIKNIYTNEAIILKAINDRTLINELKINSEDIVKCVKLAKNEVDELEELVKKSYKSGETFENLCKRLGGHNLSLDEKFPSYNYFDLNYKSLLITVKQDLDVKNKPGEFLIQKDDVYVYPNNIYKGAADNLFTLNFNENIDFDTINNSINCNDFAFDDHPISNPINDNSGVLSFYCDIEFSEPLIRKLKLEEIVNNDTYNCEIYFDLNVLERTGCIRINTTIGNKNQVDIKKLSDIEYSEVQKHAEGYIFNEWRDFNPFTRELNLIEFYITKVLYDEKFEYDANIDCEDCFILADGINKIYEYYDSISQRIELHEIIDIFTEEIKTGTKLNKEAFMKLSKEELIRQFEILDLIHGEKIQNEESCECI